MIELKLGSEEKIEDPEAAAGCLMEETTEWLKENFFKNETSDFIGTIYSEEFQDSKIRDAMKTAFEKKFKENELTKNLRLKITDVYPEKNEKKVFSFYGGIYGSIDAQTELQKKIDEIRNDQSC